ncbi:hypothetical protein [Candidatus Parabeggiatoa sp. HSG14]|uniref:hypothetical protein n=1 Tax=Candidatus Parabeggiatoa sp. HSG14 TaxID=3055593 RepID=UPI0025A8599F|nr:hypothetical protein [Thiotrichales bacterium HSG14]
MHQTGIPDGMNIIVNIQPIMPTYQEQQLLVDQLCGVWQNDPSISKIFAEIDEQRHRSLPRDITFDLSS